MAHQLIGFVGRRFAGKDTAAGVLYGHGYQNVKFAGALKEMVRTLLSYQGLDRDTIERMVEGDLKEGDTEFLYGKTPRWAMQSLGTEWGRDLIGTNFWLDAAMRRAEGKKTVITDCRFPNEAQAIRDAGGYLIRVYDPAFVAPADDHLSEALIDALEVDAEIANPKGGPGNIIEFQRKIVDLLGLENVL